MIVQANRTSMLRLKANLPVADMGCSWLAWVVAVKHMDQFKLVISFKGS